MGRFITFSGKRAPLAGVKGGSDNYSEESFDDFYYGKGSTFPDINGSIGILFEQASSRGHIQDTSYGTMTFAFTIRNQYATSMATVKAATENIGTLRKYQQDFFKSAVNNTPKTGFVSYEFGDSFDKNRTKASVLNMRH